MVGWRRQNKARVRGSSMAGGWRNGEKRGAAKRQSRAEQERSACGVEEGQEVRGITNTAEYGVVGIVKGASAAG